MESPTNEQPQAVEPTTQAAASHEGDKGPQGPAGEGPVQVDKATFLAARLREALSEVARLREILGELQVENGRLRAETLKVEIGKIDEEFDVGQGTILQARSDGTYWRVPRSAVQQG